MSHSAPTEAVGVEGTSPPHHSTAQLPLLDLPNGVTAWNCSALEDERRSHNADGHADRLMQTINVLGVHSKEAQSLNTTLTSVARLRENKQARLYLACYDGRGVGILKVGAKKLFVTHPTLRSLVEIDPLCVLDFYVENTCQRQGIGKMLFDFMLSYEQLRPEEVAIDRPSVKFLSFLRKHYGLVEYTPQSNNFVVFHRYFERWQPRGRQSRSLERPHAKTTTIKQQEQNHRQQLKAEQEQQNQPPEGGQTHPSSLMLGKPQERVKTAYEQQYEEYIRKQACRAGQGGAATGVGFSGKPGSSSGVCAAAYNAGCQTSPTRSGVSYNIISGAPARS